MWPAKTYRILKHLSKTVRCVTSPASGTIYPRVVFGEVIYYPGGSYGPTAQKSFQLCGILDGSVEIKSGNGRPAIHIGPGEIALQPPTLHVRQYFSTTCKTHQIWCSIHPRMLTKRLREICRRTPGVFPMSHRMERLINLGLSLPQGNTPGTQGLIESLGITALREHLFVAERRNHPEATPPNALRRALEWIELKGTDVINLKGLADIAGVSPASLSRLFNHELDISPMRYLWKARTRFGVQLLCDTDLSIAEVSSRAGFQTAFHFSRLARLHFGQTPRELRSRIKSGKLADMSLPELLPRKMHL